MNLSILALEDCQASDIFSLLDCFVTAGSVHGFLFGEGAPEIQWRIVSPDGQPVTAANGFEVDVDAGVDAVRKTDLIWVPGLVHTYGHEVVEGARNAQPALDWLNAMHAKGAKVATHCSGSFVLGAAGLLDGRRATTSWWLVHSFAKAFPDVNLEIEAIMTEDDGVYTAGAMTAYLNLGLHLIETYYGEAVANYCAKVMLLDGNRDSQMPYLSLQSFMGHSDEIVSRAQSWMQKNIHRQFDLELVAEKSKTSKRTLIRRFKQALDMTPNNYLQGLRIERAKQLLETSSLSLEKITEKVGYLDVSTFSQLFKKKVRASPSDYRKRFGSKSAFRPH